MKRAFFFVESPMQLITAIEAKHYFKPSKCILFIRYNKIKRNDEQIDKILNYSTFDQQHSIKIKEYSKFAYIKTFYLYALLLMYRPDVLFVGDYKSNFFKLAYKLFRKKDCIFLDDGAQSSYIYDLDKQANMFSYFKFEHDPSSSRMYVHNTFEYFKSVMKSESREVLDKVTYFIGAPLVEKDMITEEQFHYYFSKVATFYNEIGWTIKYLPHRHENNDKLNKYANVEIMLLDEPVELYLLHTKILPTSVSSFYSAALYSIQLLFSEIMVGNTSFYFPPQEMNIPKDIQKKIDDVYDTFSKVMCVNYLYYK